MREQSEDTRQSIRPTSQRAYTPAQMPTAPAPITNAPPILWAAARVLITSIFALFGDPSAIAAQHTHHKSERSLLPKWLRAGEAFMRHLLLIEAACYARPNRRPLLRLDKPLPRKRKRRLMTFEADKPEAWRVSFRCLERRLPAGPSLQKANSPQAKAQCRLEAGAPKRFYSAWPLAERAEALLRAFNNPEPYAKRLARRLYATPSRAAALTQHPPNFPEMVEDFARLQSEAYAARRRFESG